MIGLGYTGYLIDKALTKTGNNAVFHDINKDVVKKSMDTGYSETTDVKRAVK